MQRATTDAPAGSAAIDVELAVALPVLLESIHQPATGILIVWMEPAADPRGPASMFRVETDLPDQVEADVRSLPGVLTVETTSIEADG